MVPNLSYEVNNRYHFIDFAAYFVSALLVATLFCYVLFFFKVYWQNQQVNIIDQKIAAYGTPQQKAHEKQVFDYKKKIDDFAGILVSHKISLKIFNFIEEKTLPNVWFSSFDVSQAANEIRLLGEAENMETLSRQISFFENSDNVNTITVLNSQINNTGKIQFTLVVSLNPKLFSYMNSAVPVK